MMRRSSEPLHERALWRIIGVIVEIEDVLATLRERLHDLVDEIRRREP
jgi:hypothetical protein